MEKTHWMLVSAFLAMVCLVALCRPTTSHHDGTPPRPISVELTMVLQSLPTVMCERDAFHHTARVGVWDHPTQFAWGQAWVDEMKRFGANGTLFQLAWWPETPAYACPDDERLGDAFVGSWVCGVNRLLAPPSSTEGASPCTVYSFTHGANGVDVAAPEQVAMYSIFRGLPNDMAEKYGVQPSGVASLEDRYPFEAALKRRAPQCRVHVFHSLNDVSGIQGPPSDFVMHSNAFLASRSAQDGGAVAGTLRAHMDRLGHSRVSLLRIDTPVALNALPEALLVNPSADTVAERWGSDEGLPTQIQIQFYTGGQESNETLTQVRRIMDRLVEKYVLFHIDVPPTPPRIHQQRTRDWWRMQAISTVELSLIQRRFALSPFHVPLSALDLPSNPWAEEMMRSFGCGKRAIKVSSAKLTPDSVIQVPLRHS